MTDFNWTATFGEVKTAAQWTDLGDNDRFLLAYTGDGTNAIQQFVYNVSGAVASGTTILPWDDTIPQNTEGVQFMTQAITPKSATNLLEIVAVLYLSFSIPESISTALFQDSTANALAAMTFNQDVATGTAPTVLRHIMVAGTTSSTTFKIRAGANAAGTITFNGASAARKFGGITLSSLSITEYKV